jgi:dipeptidyl aminopeptidase/acylaminoacyl peptidase
MVQGAERRTTNKSGSLIFVLILISVYASSWILDPVLACPPQALPVESILRSNSFGELTRVTFSPDGKWLAYVAKENGRANASPGEYQRTGVPPWAHSTNIFVVNVPAHSTRSLTGDAGDNWDPRWAPDGRSLAFLSDRDGSGRAKLWIWDPTKDELRKVSETVLRSSDIEWMPDSRKIIVTTLPEGLRASEHPEQVQSGERGETFGSALASTVIVYHGRSAEKGVDKAAPQSDPWDLDWALCDLAIVDTKTGNASTIVRNRRISTFSLSPDGMLVAYTSPTRFERAGSQQVLFDISSVSPFTNGDHILASGIRLGYKGAEWSWSPDSRHLSYRQYGPGEIRNDLFVIDVNNGASERRTTLAPHRGGPLSGCPLWDRQGRYLYFITGGALWRASTERSSAVELASIPNRSILDMVSQSVNLLWTAEGGKSTVVLVNDSVGKQNGFYKVDLTTGETTRLRENGQCYTCNNLSEGQFATPTPDGRLLAYFAEGALHPEDLWLSDPDFRKPERLTHLNAQFDQYEMGAAQVVVWKGDDGDSLQGALVLPPGYQKGQRYPLVVWVYGGESLSDRLSKFGLLGQGVFNIQLLATRGYVIFCPDAPQHLGTPMMDLAKSVLPGVNKLVEMGIVDPDRIGIIGHSHGGYTVLALIAQTSRFRAAIEVDGLGDLIGAYGQMDQNGSAFQTTITEEGQGLIGGTPWQYRERYIENSPIFYFDRVETPLLIVHGSLDTTVAPYLGDEVFVALRRLGKEVEYAKYEGEGHVPAHWSYANQLDFCNRMISWLDEHLKGSRTR